MERYLYRHAMDDWVSLPGRLSRPQIREILAGADVYVAPAELESFGLAALEARCVGLPVVAMAQGGVGEFVTHGREGLLVPDRNGLTEALVRLCADDRLRAEMRAHNTSVGPDLGWGDVLARTDALYDMAKARGRLHGSLVAEPAAA
jgi:glycosyltransferase involved in cell wall biosynthesis